MGGCWIRGNLSELTAMYPAATIIEESRGIYIEDRSTLDCCLLCILYSFGYDPKWPSLSLLLVLPEKAKLQDDMLWTSFGHDRSKIQKVAACP